jgi:hypothetical protein
MTNLGPAPRRCRAGVTSSPRFPDAAAQDEASVDDQHLCFVT